MKLLHSMDAESGDLRPNHNLKLVFSPVRHVYHRSAVFQILPFLQFLLRMDLYIPFHRSKSYIRIFQDQFLLHLGNVPLLCLLTPACQSRLPALCFLLCKAEVHTFFPSEPAQKNSLFFLLQPLRTEADFLLFFSYSVSFLTASHLFRISLHSLYL